MDASSARNSSSDPHPVASCLIAISKSYYKGYKDGLQPESLADGKILLSHYCEKWAHKVYKKRPSVKKCDC